MRFTLLLSINVVLILSFFTAKSQNIDTLIDVGGYKLHFNIVKGKGIPILFESGGGDDGTVWNRLLPYIADSLAATLITYDRAGFGKSELDTNKLGIINSVKGLETGLQKLGYTGKIMLVAHSLGGFYATLFASRHPRSVKAAVLIDANASCFFTDSYVTREQNRIRDQMKNLKKENPGVYYIYANIRPTADIMRKTPFPGHIPVIDIVAERTPFEGTPDAKRWKNCHRQFVKASSNRERIIAYGSGHYIFREKPDLVFDAIVQTYSRITVK